MDVAKRRSDKSRLPMYEHTNLSSRLSAIAQFREQHEKLLSVFAVVLSDHESHIVTDLMEAYKLFVKSNDDVLDTSQEGLAAWSAAYLVYEKRLESTEESVTRLLEDR